MVETSPTYTVKIFSMSFGRLFPTEIEITTEMSKVLDILATIGRDCLKNGSKQTVLIEVC